ncbi:MAG: lactonase family protein [Gemmataceae bacterium]|nr:lactonase family protein [Gemmataceae bacterium]MCI0740114.1 lactonase family protein [Gemmataceae bacterium]
MNRCLLALLVGSVLLPLSAFAQGDKGETLWVFFGTYTGKTSKGIYRSEFDTKTGKLSKPELAAETKSPSFLAVHPNRRFLYAVNEIGDYLGKKSGSVTAFALDPTTGSLEKLNEQTSSGAAPCHLVVDREGKNVLVANYTGGSVSVLPIGADGKLGEPTSAIQHEGKSATKKQTPHAHAIHVDATNRFAFAADLGLDKVLLYRFDAAAGKLSANDPPAVDLDPGAGPRHFAFHPNAPFAFVINETLLTLTVLPYDASKGILTKGQTVSTLPADAKGKGFSTAEVQVHPSGKFVYGSNRGHNSIAIFSFDADKGTLRLVGHQSHLIKTPRNFGIDPTGQFLLAASQNADQVIVFRINQESGELTPTGGVVNVPTPVCVKFVPKG